MVGVGGGGGGGREPKLRRLLKLGLQILTVVEKGYHSSQNSEVGSLLNKCYSVSLILRTETRPTPKHTHTHTQKKKKKREKLDNYHLRPISKFIKLNGKQTEPLFCNR